MARGRRQGRLLLPPFGGIAPWEVAVRVLVLPGEGRGRLRQRGTQPACPDVRCHVKKTEVGKGFGQLVARRLVQHRIASTAAPHASALLGHSAACAGRTHRPCFRPRRRDVHRQLGIPCEEREDPYCTRPPGDKLYCHLARQRGFDSIQIAQAHFNFRPEMIVCHGKCATAAVRTACPPIPLRSHANGRRPCKCDKRSALMNCGEAQVNCSFARPERAVLWHHACRTGLYERCINGSGSPSRLPV